VVAVAFAPKAPADPWPNAPHTEQEIRDKLTHARELLLEHDRGLTGKGLARDDITRRLDKWLEALCELKELRWIEELETS
jgi:hypothetical protein